MQELEKILEEFGSYICDDLCYYRETSADKKDDEMEEICAGCKVGEYLESICKHMNDGWIPVEKRLPENNKLVLVWARSTARGADEWSLGSYDKGFWALGSYGGSLAFPSQLEAVAWRPLPEPYRTERSDGE